MWTTNFTNLNYKWMKNKFAGESMGKYTEEMTRQEGAVSTAEENMGWIFDAEENIGHILYAEDIYVCKNIAA
jgi:hypothetical protein